MRQLNFHSIQSNVRVHVYIDQYITGSERNNLIVFYYGGPIVTDGLIVLFHLDNINIYHAPYCSCWSVELEYHDNIWDYNIRWCNWLIDYVSSISLNVTALRKWILTFNFDKTMDLNSMILEFDSSVLPSIACRRFQSSALWLIGYSLSCLNNQTISPDEILETLGKSSTFQPICERILFNIITFSR